MAKSGVEEVHALFVDKDDDLMMKHTVNIREGIGIGNEFLALYRVWR